MKTKYVIFSDGNSPHTLKWVKELVKLYDVFLITLNGYNQDILLYIDVNKIYSFNNKVNSSGGNYLLITKFFKILEIIKKIQPQYLNAHYLSSYGVLAALIKSKNKNLKLIQSTWGSDILVTPNKTKLHRLIAKYALSKSDLITSDSYFMSDEIKNIYQCGNILTFPFGLDNDDNDAEVVKKENLIFSNRALSKNYNIDIIIKWFAELENKDLKLVIANDGSMKNDLIRLVKNLGLEKSIKFVGFLDKEEQNTLYKQAKFYISIPSSDSTAVSLLEAMNFGCYPIVSNLPANREWIINNCNGSFFEETIAIPLVSDDISKINQIIIHKNAIFSASVENFIVKLESL